MSDIGDVFGKVIGFDFGNNKNDDDENVSEYIIKGVEDGDDFSGFNVVGKVKGVFSGLIGSNKGS